MNKYLRRVGCLVLTIVLALSLGTAAFATEKPEEGKYYPFTSVYSIGDSTACGYGRPGYKVWENKGYLNALDGNYADIVAKTLSLKDKCVSLAYPAARNRDILCFLGEDIEKDAFWNKKYNEYFSHAMKDSVDSKGGNFFVNALKDDRENKLVLLYGGAADVFFASSDAVTTGGLDTSDIPGLVKNYVETLWNNYNEFLEYYPRLVEKIQELNPNATIVFLGTFNPIKNMSITDDLYLPVGDAFAVLSATLNQTVKTFAEKYDGIYVDISNVETATLERELTLGYLTGNNGEAIYHPTEAGYQYIARQILEKLEVEEPDRGSDIVIDLGSVQEVSSVKMGLLPVLNYRFDKDTHKLTIPYHLLASLNVTVTEKRDGRSYLATYQPIWNLKGGYTSYELYATKDLGRDVQNFKQLPSKLASVIKGLL